VGLFRADAYPGRAGLLPDAARSRLRSVLRWFNRNMSVPPRLPRNAVCWLRADAAGCVDRLRELVELYRLTGHPVLMQSTFVPGRVVYRDEHQVAAVPYACRRVTTSTC
jgi:hypothetical protein